MIPIKLLPSISILLATIILSGCEEKPSKDSRQSALPPATLKEHIGEKFELNNVVDSLGRPVVLDFTSSELTIIDFWFKDCPPCLEEMKQFAAALAGKEKKITIVSISVNQPWVWKPLLSNPKGLYSFLDYDVPNWKQYALQTADNPKFKNEISFDRTEDLKRRYGVSFFPAYFVVDRSGTIQSRPLSAVAFIKGANY